MIDRFNEGKRWLKVFKCCKKPHRHSAGTSILDASNSTPSSAGTGGSVEDDEDLLSGLGVGTGANGSDWWWSASGDGPEVAPTAGGSQNESKINGTRSIDSSLGSIVGTLCERWLLALCPWLRHGFLATLYRQRRHFGLTVTDFFLLPEFGLDWGKAGYPSLILGFMFYVAD
ncbi:hypothetical protein HDU67_005932 [Dinochytrium kinnereticum]|nr:hypothetical protein HDU67_005932 [Dinochytrium kinnereticum]